MTVYLLLPVISLLVPLCTPHSNKHNNLYLYFMCFLMFLLVALRGNNVGTDTGTYVRMFNMISSFAWSDILNWHTTEKSFFMICKAVSDTGGNAQMMLAVYAFITMFCFAKFIQKNSVDFVMSVFLFITTYQLCSAMNAMRQFAAISVACLGYGYLVEKKLIKYMCVVGLACILHMSAVCMLPAIWFMYTEPKNRNIMWIIIGFAAAFIGFQTLMDTFCKFLPKKYSLLYISSKYMAGYTPKAAFIIWIALFTVAFLGCYALSKLKFCDYHKRYELYILTSLVIAALCTNIFVMRFFIANRFSIYYFIYIIIFIPKLAEIYCCKKIFYAVCIPLLSIYYLLVLSVVNGCDVVPYIIF
ncbi:MAG: EpsG family protein [Synergistaceae bacterium]|nr:EpsG family protein [Candidatus Equadaptatus faecalis]